MLVTWEINLQGGINTKGHLSEEFKAEIAEAVAK